MNEGEVRIEIYVPVNIQVKKEKDDQVLSYTVGEKVGYKVTVNVPADATKTFQVTDKPSVGLQVLLDDTFVVKSDGVALASGTDYTVVKNADNGGYTFNLVTSSNWIGKQITIDYNMEVTSQAVTESGLVNNVSVDTDTKKDQKCHTNYYKHCKKRHKAFLKHITIEIIFLTSKHPFFPPVSYLQMTVYHYYNIKQERNVSGL